MFLEVALHINHSCNPNTFVIDIRDTQVTVAARDIEQGEEVTQIYLGHFGDTDREQRQRLLLDKYHFQCRRGNILSLNGQNMDFKKMALWHITKWLLRVLKVFLLMVWP